jgi:hypothetical protein
VSHGETPYLAAIWTMVSPAPGVQSRDLVDADVPQPG